MSNDAPPFWWEPADFKAWALSPIALIYRIIADRKMVKAAPPKLPVPVICVGNLTVGGSGKTPTALALSNAAKELGLTPGILSRGYGGHEKGPHIVDLTQDTAHSVGDEPLVLAKSAMVCVGAERLASAELLIHNGCDLLIMDDGFQSQRIHMDFALCAVDGKRGIGNGYVLPAGPLRASIKTQMVFVDGLVINGQGDAAETLVRIAARAGKPVFHASYQPIGRKARKRVFAFAGIADPEKFFGTLKAEGYDLAGHRAFGDHYQFKRQDLDKLAQDAAAVDAHLITTEKDAARLHGGSETEHQFMKNCAVLKVELKFDAPDAPERIIKTAQEAYRQRI